MNVEEATKIVQMPYNTEKTFAMVESEGKVCFLVERSATKPSIIDAVEILYGTRPVSVNTARTVYGKSLRSVNISSVLAWTGALLAAYL